MNISPHIKLPAIFGTCVIELVINTVTFSCGFCLNGN
jgi:hypothetical protein